MSDDTTWAEFDGIKGRWVGTCPRCGTDHGGGWPPGTMLGEAACAIALMNAQLRRFHASLDAVYTSERPPGRRTVRAHRDPIVLHHAGTDRYSTTPGVTVAVDYTPGEGKAAMDALMSAVGEVRKQIEEER